MTQFNYLIAWSTIPLSRGLGVSVPIFPIVADFTGSGVHIKKGARKLQHKLSGYN